MPATYENLFASIQLYIGMVSSPPLEVGEIENHVAQYIDNFLRATGEFPMKQSSAG